MGAAFIEGPPSARSGLFADFPSGNRFDKRDARVASWPTGVAEMDGDRTDITDADRAARARLLETVLEVFPPPTCDGHGRDPRRHTALYRNDPDAEVGGTFVSQNSILMNKWRKYVDEQLKERGQSLLRWQVLFELAANKPRETLKSIANRFGIVGPSLVGLFNDLEADGYINRFCDPADRRSKIIVLTEEGKQLVAELLAFLTALREDFLQGVEDSEIRLMLDVHNRMSANLDRMTGSEPD